MTEHEIPVDRTDIEALHTFLSSDRAPEGGMTLSGLDGFLTAIAIGPEPVLPSEWLPVIWGGGERAFADEAEAKTVIGAIMGRFNKILPDQRAERCLTRL